METSAKTGENVEKAFTDVATAVVNKLGMPEPVVEKRRVQQPNINVNITHNAGGEQEGKKKGGGCC